MFFAGEGLVVLGVGSTARDWDPRLENALAAVVLIALLAAMTLLFPLLASSFAHALSDGRVPLLGVDLLMPGLQALTLAVAIAFVPIFHPTGLAALALVIAGAALMVGARALAGGGT